MTKAEILERRERKKKEREAKNKIRREAKQKLKQEKMEKMKQEYMQNAHMGGYQQHWNGPPWMAPPAWAMGRPVMTPPKPQMPKKEAGAGGPPSLEDKTGKKSYGKSGCFRHNQRG